MAHPIGHDEMVWNLPYIYLQGVPKVTPPLYWGDHWPVPGPTPALNIWKWRPLFLFRDGCLTCSQTQISSVIPLTCHLSSSLFEDPKQVFSWSHSSWKPSQYHHWWCCVYMHLSNLSNRLGACLHFRSMHILFNDKNIKPSIPQFVIWQTAKYLPTTVIMTPVQSLL